MPVKSKMGRPPSPKGTLKDHTVAVRFTAREFRRMKAAAGKQKISEWMRGVLNEASGKGDA